MHININRHLFAVYWGLFSSGYDLMDKGDPFIRRICDRIGQAAVPPSVASYFALARTGGEGANPYYPRGSDLSAACFFQQKTLEEYIEFLSFCDSPSLHDPGFLPWILSLPPLLRIIEEKAGFESLFQEYRQEALTRFACVDAAMEEITGVLKDNGLYQDVFLCFAPNLLQSPYLVDYALADNTLYIIGAVFSRTAVLHEYLHLLLHDRKAFFLQMAGEKELSHFADAALLRRLGYLPDDSLSSRAHALEDCFIRSLSGVLAGEKSAGDYVRTQKELGFVILPELMERLRNLRRGERGLDAFLQQFEQLSAD